MLVPAVLLRGSLCIKTSMSILGEREREEVLKMNQSVTIRDWSHIFGGRGKS